MIIVYGIKNCDSVRKARRWLQAHELAHRFHDVRTEGLTRERLLHWCQQCGWERVLNRRGRSFRLLSQEQTTDLSAERALELMLAEPTLIKRPVLEHESEILIGFDAEIYARLVG